jgi:hypothetical protein
MSGARNVAVGGERAYKGCLGKDRSPRPTGHSLRAQNGNLGHHCHFPSSEIPTMQRKKLQFDSLSSWCITKHRTISGHERLMEQSRRSWSVSRFCLRAPKDSDLAANAKVW